MDAIKIMWQGIAAIFAKTFIICGFKLSFGGLLIFSCGFFICWFVVGKLMR